MKLCQSEPLKNEIYHSNNFLSNDKTYIVKRFSCNALGSRCNNLKEHTYDLKEQNIRLKGDNALKDRRRQSDRYT